MSKYPLKHTHFRTCHLCEAMCGLQIEVEGNEIKAIKGDENDPFSQGYICPKAVALQDIYSDKDRLKFPVKRTGKKWKMISWEQAFNEVVDNIKLSQKKYGNNSIGVYVGNPSSHNYGINLYLPLVLEALNTQNEYSATSVDHLPHLFASLFMFGHSLLVAIPDILRTDHFLIIGANPYVSNGSLMSAGGIPDKLKALHKRGGKVTVVDPRKTETAVKADRHIFIRPGTDVLFLLSFIYILFEEKLVKTGRLSAYTDRKEVIQDVVKEFPPEKTASITGINPLFVKELAFEFAKAKSAVCYGRTGVSTQPFGGICQWLINVINLLSDNFDEIGGAMFTTPAIDVVKLSSKSGLIGGFDRWRSRVRNLPEFDGKLPVATLAEEILTKGEGQIKGMLTIAGNPVLSTPNGTQLDRAFEQLDFMVSIDIYINETTRHANIILPPATGLESDHFDLLFNACAIQNTVKYSPPLFQPERGMKYDWQILKILAKRLKNKDQKFLKILENPLGKLPLIISTEKVLDLLLKLGPYGIFGKQKDAKNISLKRLKNSPHGLILGFLQPCFPKRLFTENKRIDMAPQILVDDLERVNKVFFSENGNMGYEYDLLLIGRRHLRSNNSWMHNSYRLVKGENRCTLLMHPKDAEKRKLKDGQVVEVVSKVGVLPVPVEITDHIMQGVVSIPHGWGHHNVGSRLQIAQQHAGVNVNDLVNEMGIDELTGNAVLNGVPVMVKLKE